MTLGLRALALTAIVVSAAVLPAHAAERAPQGSPVAPEGATLSAWSVLPAATYVPGSETSGHWTSGNAAIPAPYPGQPVQGFSGTHALGGGSFLVLSDNGFGRKSNSADFLLSLHRITPETVAADGDGATTYDKTLFTMSDPDHLVPWPIWRDGACQQAASLPAGYACPTADRQLTGWDFDPESLQVAKDGTFWVGEEFGPFLLHLNAGGELIEAPIPTPGVKSPSNPTLGGAVPEILDSKGFEGMSISPNGQVLHPMLEGATAEDKAAGLANDLRIYTVRKGEYAESFLRYRMESAGNALGDFIQINKDEALVIERDGGQGATAVFKRIYLVDLRDADGNGYVEKRLLVDLMNVTNPDGLSPYGDPFTFPFVTIEDVEILDAQTIAVMNDNNFPATGGRSSSQPDQNEYLEITLAAPLKVDHRLLPGR
ncbi:esterase-like activity of phytase family protein [Nocardioides sp.]|uniref:esterase-like activity of phytase family protein n=1 Tax=Nocardioides sp. TaxID=35761 RepID=UPI002C66FC96|nr:esterase-like activity of phytase family protein [Nocardioides sp.]HXH79361.1 esterase-like activity of phytase family protein [Nocardioides sp.]